VKLQETLPLVHHVKELEEQDLQVLIALIAFLMAMALVFALLAMCAYQDRKLQHVQTNTLTT
jgi:hypothetical protein